MDKHYHVVYCPVVKEHSYSFATEQQAKDIAKLMLELFEEANYETMHINYKPDEDKTPVKSWLWSKKTQSWLEWPKEK